MAVKEELHRLVDVLEEEDAHEALDYVRWLLEDSETLTDEEIARVEAGKAQMERGEYVTLEELRRQLGE